MSPAPARRQGSALRLLRPLPGGLRSVRNPNTLWRSRAAKGKKVKNQKLLCPGEAEAKVEVPEARLVPAAMS